MIPTGFEQFAIGQIFESAPLAVGAEDIKAFALLFDMQPQHVDEDSARSSIFGTLVASGWHTASLTMRLLLESVLAGVPGRGIGVKVEALEWRAPVYPGDALQVVTEVTELRPSRTKPDRGLVVMRIATRNQDGSVVQHMVANVLVLRSAAPA